MLQSMGQQRVGHGLGLNNNNTTPFNIKDWRIHIFWYPQGSWNSYLLEDGCIFSCILVIQANVPLKDPLRLVLYSLMFENLQWLICFSKFIQNLFLLYCFMIICIFIPFHCTMTFGLILPVFIDLPFQLIVYPVWDACNLVPQCHLHNL